MTVLERTAAGRREQVIPTVEPEFLRRCLLLAIPTALSVALLLATLNLSSAVHLAALAGPGFPNPEPGEGRATEPSAVLAPVFTPEVRYWSGDILRWSSEFGLDPNLVAAVMQIESCGDPAAVSPAGARGLFQVMPYHFAAGEDPLDPETNARRGLAYLAESLVHAGGQVDRALAGYNGGHAVISWPAGGWPAETRRYVAWGTGILAGIGETSSPNRGLAAWLAAGGSRLCSRAAASLDLPG